MEDLVAHRISVASSLRLWSIMSSSMSVGTLAISRSYIWVSAWLAWALEEEDFSLFEEECLLELDDEAWSALWVLAERSARESELPLIWVSEEEEASTSSSASSATSAVVSAFCVSSGRSPGLYIYTRP